MLGRLMMYWAFRRNDMDYGTEGWDIPQVVFDAEKGKYDADATIASRKHAINLEDKSSEELEEMRESHPDAVRELEKRRGIGDFVEDDVAGPADMIQEQQAPSPVSDREIDIAMASYEKRSERIDLKNGYLDLRTEASGQIYWRHFKMVNGWSHLMDEGYIDTKAEVQELVDSLNSRKATSHKIAAVVTELVPYTDGDSDEAQVVEVNGRKGLVYSGDADLKLIEDYAAESGVQLIWDLPEESPYTEVDRDVPEGYGYLQGYTVKGTPEQMNYWKKRIALEGEYGEEYDEKPAEGPVTELEVNFI